MSVGHEIARLETLSSAALRSRWVALTDSAAPKVSPKMLRLALAWEIQARLLGGLSREVTRTLDQLARGATRTAPASAGMRLVREWQGRVHIVTVGEDQVIRWDGKEWRSLSEVAREITGTRWSGPAFFGLKKKVAA
jgi:predicted component of type VI protein secretion system